MDELLTLILTPLTDRRDAASEADPALAKQIRTRFEVARQDLDSDEVYQLKEALQDVPEDFSAGWWLDPARCRWWLCLHVDWKASEEVEWQVQAIGRTLGLGPGFVSGLAAQTGTQTLDVLGEASAWLRFRGYVLLFLDTESDEYLAVPIRLDRLSLARQTASRMNLPTFQL